MTKFEIVVPLEWGVETFSKIRDIIQSKCKEYAWAQHPIDELSSFEHWHIGCTLHSNFSADSLLKWFKDIPVIKNNSIQSIKSTFKTYVVYILHKTESAIKQGKSAPVDYGGNAPFDEYLKSYEFQGDVKNLVTDILDGKIKEYEFYQNKALVAEIIKKGWYTKVDVAFKSSYTLKSLGADRMDKDRKQCWIYGLAGSGKTELAKYTCRSYGYKDIDIYVSSSGNNPFDDYKGQPCIIVDDVDANTMTPKTCLKLADLFTNSFVNARYFNKQIIAECIIFTSTCSPSTWWKNVSTEKTDGNVFQLYRRLNMGIWHIDDLSVEVSLYNGQGDFVSKMNVSLPKEIADKVKSKTMEKTLDNLRVVFGDSVGHSLSFDVNNIKFDGFMEVKDGDLPKGLFDN